ncbi:signaling lymphocytic activation molecule-like isoform X2 [Siniperca chuatsi]|uniref:signaling lymphocytic activation molecule-like isoform X2 n=1 Tax=Siniperca chuatsi TaxID=119488 RepID=UPI001CE1F502|nr:signaling lymphocytic activation molecule-like isoform X2 [Siniperca chuatsi]
MTAETEVEASSCQHVIHKKVGDTVEFSSCLPTEKVNLARWKYGTSIIADKDNVVPEKQFSGRLNLNPTNFSLTVRGLTLRDSGDFTFISEVNDKQRDTVTITLQVHEPITEEPVLSGNSTWRTSTNSCTVLLECSATSDSSVTYNWTVRNQTISGSSLQYSIRPQDGDTKFTCTIYNFVSEESASKIVKCSNNTQEISTETGPVNFAVVLILAGGGCLLIVIIVGIAVGVCHCKQSRAGSDSTDLTVYADISEITNEDGTSSTMKPCSVYETIDNRVNSVTPGPQTVYDKIQFNRVRQASVSPYQDIS